MNSLDKLHKLQIEKEFRESLPHLYGYKFYKWSRTFFESLNKTNLLCAANQISKSSTNIRKCVHWSTESSLYPKLWKNPPRQYWYMYPSKDLATAEFETKWVPEFMPRGKMERHAKYGWQAKYKNGLLDRIIWNNGPPTYFKAYTQDVHRIQASTIWAAFIDEELPEDMYDEVRLRLTANDGYFNMVFTATRGQALWYRAMERQGKKDEAFKTALKINATMYDCLTYEDGDPDTPWTKEKIQGVIDNCATENEVLKRVYGRFVIDEGLKLQSFERGKNVVKPYPIPKDWHIYSGVDIGSGGKGGHPAAIAFVAVRPDMQKGALFRGWRGSKAEVTTSKDILDRYRLLRGKLKPVMQSYDWASKDFETYAIRLHETFIKADKSPELGEDMLNTLFASGMLDVFDIEELEPFVEEFTSLRKNENKINSKDDAYDATRFAVTRIPWDYTAIADQYNEHQEKIPDPEFDEIAERRKMDFDEDNIGQEIEDELSGWNDLLEG